ncbi:hypothetical protein MIND_00127200 [Mycena indigotica]|uniref:Uncharacterized protein n=1 Tax=Mycena indigotica TaxID=2126181 RepID=A0A8H6TG74_9AGAR|nr:uncharacterized protein MIND_00127200 [Mycena indigotica]KAF7316091.1 hypothetical protein MIND_00127200 [Mycena indigotica]
MASVVVDDDDVAVFTDAFTRKITNSVATLAKAEFKSIHERLTDAQRSTASERQRRVAAERDVQQLRAELSVYKALLEGREVRLNQADKEIRDLRSQLTAVDETRRQLQESVNQLFSGTHKVVPQEQQNQDEASQLSSSPHESSKLLTINVLDDQLEHERPPLSSSPPPTKRPRLEGHTQKVQSPSPKTENATTIPQGQPAQPKSAAPSFDSPARGPLATPSSEPISEPVSEQVIQDANMIENKPRTASLTREEVYAKFSRRQKNFMELMPHSRHRLNLSAEESFGDFFSIGPDLFLATSRSDCERPITQLHALQLSTFKTMDYKPQTINLGESMLDFAVQIAQYDLLLVLNRNLSKDPECQFQVQCWTYTSGQKGHALATHDTFFVQLPSDELAPISGAISLFVCDNILAISFYYQDRNDFGLTLYDWKLGTHLCGPGRIGGPKVTFISSKQLMTFNADLGSLDIIWLPNSDSDNGSWPADLNNLVKVSFKLPELRAGYAIVPESVQMNAQPTSSAPLSVPPHCYFVPMLTEGLILVLMEIGPIDKAVDAPLFALVISRRLLRQFRLAHHSSAKSVAWANWGHKCSRWLDPQRSSGCVEWSVMGERVVLLDKDAGDKRDRHSSLRILDFNVRNIDKARQISANHDRIWIEPPLTSSLKPGSDSSNTKHSSRNGGSARPEPSSLPFSVPILSDLGFVRTLSEDKYRFDQVLMTEDSVVGIRWKHWDNKTRNNSPYLDIFRFEP